MIKKNVSNTLNKSWILFILFLFWCKISLWWCTEIKWLNLCHFLNTYGLSCSFNLSQFFFQFTGFSPWRKSVFKATMSLTVREALCELPYSSRHAVLWPSPARLVTVDYYIACHIVIFWFCLSLLLYAPSLPNTASCSLSIYFMSFKV